mmetsp:Transcript_9249/g.11675  ORF Transcript_9249/g.11675 Transcript_9249/m.11675 type:complete len:216 (-) Transcript_9249:1210-1857(-)
MTITLFIFVCTALLALVIIWIARCIITVNQQTQQLLVFNNEDWHVDKLSKPIYLVRFINAVGLGCGASCFASFMLLIIDKTAVQPSLKKSLKLMKSAEESGNVPLILCDHQARHGMEARIHDYYMDIRSSKSMNVMSKILNYAGAAHCLSNHYGLLKLGMSAEVSKENIVEPVFIVSLPRTGTTILHRTMALDRDTFRNFDLCDMVLPLPTPIPR